MVADDALHRRADEEVLLLQAQQLALGVVVGGVEHLGDGLRLGAFLQCLCILSLCEQRHVEVGDVARAPQTQAADRVAVRARDHHVVGNRLDFVAILIADVAVPLRPLLHDLPAEADAERAVGAGNQPDLAAGQPDVGKLDLKPVNNLLLEQTVLVTDGEAGRRVVQRGQRIHIAGGQSAEAAVAETGVVFRLEYIRGIAAEIGQRSGECVRYAEVECVFHEAATHEEFHGQIVHLAVGASCLFNGEQSAHYFADDDGACLKHLIVGRGFCCHGKVRAELILYCAAHLVA